VVADSWHSTTSPADPLLQGDQLLGVEHLEPRLLTLESVSVVRQYLDIVVVTQSCDIEDFHQLLVAQMLPLYDWLSANPNKFGQLESIRKGEFVSLYILPALPGVPAFEEDRIALLSEIRSLPAAEIQKAVDDGCARLQIQSPSREHFAQAVARSFMRVALPKDIPRYVWDPVATETKKISSLSDGSQFRKEQSVVVKHKRRSAQPDVVTVCTLSEGGSSLDGVGRDEMQAMQSLESELMFMRDSYKEGTHPSWKWVADLFT
jgi:hypothetical protein